MFNFNDKTGILSNTLILFFVFFYVFEDFFFQTISSHGSNPRIYIGIGGASERQTIFSQFIIGGIVDAS